MDRPETPQPAQPITAVVIFCNEESLLAGCLHRLHWVDELICVDMSSTDGSLAIAQQFADKVFRVPRFPVAEPTRVAVLEHCTHDWVLMVDPDEHINPPLVAQVRKAMREHPDAGAISLPWRFRFKGDLLAGTIWGGGLKHKRMLTHQQRTTMLPYCNRINEVKNGFTEVLVEGDEQACIEHYWCKGYRDLMHRHLVRYPRLDARRMHDDGIRFSLKRAVVTPWVELKRCLKDFDGWRMGLCGFALSGIYAAYHLLQQWMLLLPSVRHANTEQVDTRLPDLEAVYQRPQPAQDKHNRKQAA